MIGHTPPFDLPPMSCNNNIMQYIPSVTNMMGLIVSDIDDAEDCHELICRGSYPCAGIAFVHYKRIGFINRLRLTLQLSRYNACPCHIVRHHEEAYLWLQQRFQSYHLH